MEYKVEETYASTDMVQDSVTIAMGSAAPAPGDTFTAEDNKKASVTFTNKEAKGAILVQKNDQNGVGLAGATFRLTGPNGYNVVSDPTPSNGKVSFTDLAYGTYTLSEESAPEGYVKDNHTETIVVDASYQSTT